MWVDLEGPAGIPGRPDGTCACLVGPANDACEYSILEQTIAYAPRCGPPVCMEPKMGIGGVREGAIPQCVRFFDLNYSVDARRCSCLLRR
jgi:hypothetical protein